MGSIDSRPHLRSVRNIDPLVTLSDHQTSVAQLTSCYRKIIEILTHDLSKTYEISAENYFNKGQIGYEFYIAQSHSTIVVRGGTLCEAVDYLWAQIFTPNITTEGGLTPGEVTDVETQENNQQ